VDDEGSRFSRFMRTDGQLGRGWFAWAALSHLFLLCAPVWLVLAVARGESGDYGWFAGLTLLAGVSTAAFWWCAVRVWRRLPDPADPAPPARPAREGTETVRRLS
jgi:Na+/melibiose symporter-like transporter